NAINSGGVSVNITDSKTRNFGVSQGFITGGNLNLNFTNGITENNNPNTTFFPSYSSGLQLTGTQPLLQGFGLAYNTRGIRIAKNNLKATDYQFQLTINNTLNAVIGAYWNLVSSRQGVRVAQSSLDLAQTLLENNKKQVEIGTMAALDELQAESGAESARTALI